MQLRTKAGQSRLSRGVQANRGPMHVLNSSAIRPRAYYYERNDCTVTALAIACQVGYLRAYSILEQAGRKPDHPFMFEPFINSAPWIEGLLLPAPITLWDWPAGGRAPKCAYTTAHFVKDHPHGRFIVMTRGHVFAVTDGTVWDWKRTPRARVIRAWKFETE